MEDEETGPETALVSSKVGVLGGDGLWSVAEVLRAAGLGVVDLEPAPKTVAAEVAAKWHYGRATVRAGLLGHPRAALQLLRCELPKGWIWKGADGLAVDGLRPEVDPEGLPKEAILGYRLAHLAAVARLPAEVDRLILPLCTTKAWVDGAGTVFGARPKGVTLPTGVKLTEIPLAIKEMQDDLAALVELLRKAHPGIVVQVTLQPSLMEQPDPVATEVALRALTTVPGVIHDPVFDALLLRRLSGGGGAMALAHLAQGGDLDTLGGAPAPVVAVETDREKRQRRKERRARNKGDKGNAKVVCEDELLEAFAK